MTTPQRAAAVLDGRTIAYDRAGDAGAEPVVLLHPIGLDRTLWTEWVPPLVDDGRRVLSVDLPGHGASDREPGAPSFAGMAAAVGAVLDAEGASRAHLVGVSMGGMVAQTLAVTRPGAVASLTLCCTMATIPDPVRPAIRQRGDDARAGGMPAVADPTLERWLSPGSRASEVAARMRAVLLADDVDVFAGCWDAIAGLDTVAGLAGVDVPALVLAGGADVSLPPGAGATLAEAFPAAELVTIDDAWHLGPYEDPEPFVRRTRAHLARVFSS